MLGIGALGASSAAYYLDTVASGREDYYLGSGEAPGYWLGRHAMTVGDHGKSRLAIIESRVAGSGFLGV